MAATVLIVDDHPSFRATARMLLECDGWTVAGEAATGAEALDRADALRPDLVLLDVNLPDTDGFAVAAALTGGGEGTGPAGDGAAGPAGPAGGGGAAGPAPVVVLVSSREAADYGPRVAACGARAFLTKADLSGAALREVLGA